MQQKYVTGFRDNGELIKHYKKIYRPVFPIFPEVKSNKPPIFPSEKKLKESGQWKDIEWTVLAPNPNYNK